MGLILRIKNYFRRKKEIRLAGLIAELQSAYNLLALPGMYIPSDRILRLHKQIAQLEEELK